MADSQQYFARVHSGDVVIELSTVEIESDSDTIECFGEGPWRHFDLVDVGARTMPAVATELRLSPKSHAAAATATVRSSITCEESDVTLR